MKRTLNVWWDRRLVGELMQDEHGRLGFVYASGWLRDGRSLPLSGSLPKRAEPFAAGECRPFFAGLLPEEAQRKAAALVLRVSERNDFSLLDCLGGDVAGALQILRSGEMPVMSVLDKETGLLDDPGLVEVLDALPVQPLLAGVEGLRYSLAGAQSKVPVVLVNGEVALAVSGQPTTHILKPSMPRFPGTTENEAFMMRLASAVGLDVARVEPRVVQGRTFLLIERYDRAVSGDGRVRRIHQEDFCQALGLPPRNKYAKNGGPTFKKCFDLLRRVSAKPEADVWKLVDAAVFNAVVGNTDAHGKNFSILYGAEGPQLTPLYDLVSTVAYPNLTENFAMKMGKRRAFGELHSKGWDRFAADAGLDSSMVKERASELSKSMTACLDETKRELALPGLDQEAIERFIEIVRYRAGLCRLTLERTGFRKLPEVPGPRLADMKFRGPVDAERVVPGNGGGPSGPSRGGGPER